MKMTKSRKAVQLQTIKENENGIVAFACGIISTISFIVLIFISYLNSGQGDMGLGLFAMIFSLVGLFLGIKNIRYGDRTFFFTKAGFFINVVVVVIWAIIFIFGIYH